MGPFVGWLAAGDRRLETAAGRCLLAIASRLHSVSNRLDPLFYCHEPMFQTGGCCGWEASAAV